jgi:hypothetical protein
MSTLAHRGRVPLRHRALPAVSADPFAILTGVLVVLAVAASLAGLFADHLYRDNAYAIANWRGNDVVTLFTVAVLLGGYSFSQRGSDRGRLIWLGALWYLLYNYAFYLFGTRFNDIFLVYAGLVAGSLWALILGLSRTDVNGIAGRLSGQRAVRWIGGYLAIAAVGLAVAWIGQSLSFATGGKAPQIMIDSGASTSYVFALDLTLAVPVMLVAAVLLWRRQAWGYVLGAIMGVKGVLYASALLVMSGYQADRGQHDAWSFAPVAGFLLVGCLAVAIALLTHIEAGHRGSPVAKDR